MKPKRKTALKKRVVKKMNKEMRKAMVSQPKYAWQHPFAEKDKDEIAKVIATAVKYRNPYKKYMSVEQKEAYNRAVRKLKKKKIF